MQISRLVSPNTPEPTVLSDEEDSTTLGSDKGSSSGVSGGVAAKGKSVIVDKDQQSYKDLKDFGIDLPGI